MTSLRNLFRDYFFAGILALVPIAVTIWFVLSFVSWMDELFSFREWTGFYVPGLGLLLSLVLILVSGAVARNLVGSWLAENSRRILESIPVIGGVYGSLRQMMETFFSSEGKKLGAAVLVEYPRKGCWTIGFITRQGLPKDLVGKLEGDFVSVFIPTTPNPTSGFFIFAPKSEVRVLDVPVERALKTLVSLGLSDTPHFVAASENRGGN